MVCIMFPSSATGMKRQGPDPGDMSCKADRPCAENLAFAVCLLLRGDDISHNVCAILTQGAQ